MALYDLKTLLSENTYPGRGIVIGKSADGKNAMIAYFIMGRSENSRNRIFERFDGGMRTKAFDESKLSDPSLIIYNPYLTTKGGNIDINEEFKGIVSLYDYDIITLSHFSDDSSAGVKLSLLLTIPNGVNLCELDEHFGEPYPDDEDQEIDINNDEIGDIEINPITLPRNRIC